VTNSITPVDLVINSRAAKEIRKLPTGVLRRLQTELEKLTQDPYKGRKLEGREGYRWRFGAPGGEWQIIYRIYANEHKVFIVAVTTREKAPY
jgi:mRNA-degrading endonuclease RelE of RelBE toxin-antitoxin system